MRTLVFLPIFGTRSGPGGMTIYRASARPLPTTRCSRSRQACSSPRDRVNGLRGRGRPREDCGPNSISSSVAKAEGGRLPPALRKHAFDACESFFGVIGFNHWQRTR